MGQLSAAVLFTSFLVMFSILLSPATCCAGASPKIGNMTKDLEVKVGSSFNLTCTLFSHAITINRTTYRVTSENLLIKFKNSTLEEQDYIDDFSVQYTALNATVSDTGYYSCFLYMPQLQFNLFICSTYVAVGFEPGPVENFTCVSLNYERLNCSWDAPPNPVKTEYKLYDYLRNIFKRKCPKPERSSCEWSVDTNPPYVKAPKVLWFVVEGRNSLGENKQYISMNHLQIVKPAVPQKLMFRSVEATSLSLHWLPPRGMEYDVIRLYLDYWIHYCPADGLHTELCGTITVKGETSANIIGLVPFMTYKFMMRCRTNVSDSYWSTFLNHTVKTEPDEPYLAPETSGSSFEVQNIQNTRRVALYWKPVPSQFENGGDFGYIVKYHVHYVPHRNKRSLHERTVDVGNHTTHTFRDMDPGSDYLFRIYPKNSVGISSNYSVMVLHKAESMPPPPKEISVLSLGGGNYNISWKPMSSQMFGTDGNYTLFFCRNIKPRPFNCEGPIEWMHVHGTHQEITLPDANTNYQFAVAYNNHHSTSGMKWAQCIVPYRGVLHKVRDVVVTPDSSTSIKVHWTLDCSAQKDVIQEYAISYCPVLADLHLGLHCLGELKNVSVKNANLDQYIVDSLLPFTRYRFVVTARTADGWSEDSDARYETTMSAAPGDPPQDVRLLSVNGTEILLSFKPPTLPNGIVTHYIIFYGPVGSAYNEMKRLEYRPDAKSGSIHVVNIRRRDIMFFTNYSLQVEACVGLACSKPSNPVYAFTGIGTPGIMDPPHTEIINATLVNVTWKPPDMPNGPVDMYILTMRYMENFDQMESEEMVIFNVSGEETSVSISIDCQQEVSDGVVHAFTMQALNMRNGAPLYGRPSEASQTRLCFVNPAGLSPRVLIGLIIGIALGLTVLLLLMYSLAKWMKKKLDAVKGITIVLPTGLDSPIENPLNTYDKFKNGLQTNRDSGIPMERPYERLSSYSSDKLSKHLENSYDASSEEFLDSKSTREKNGRNQSGDSSLSCKGHDSISSSNTNKTHISIDSGAEVDLPPSPDGIFSETSSSNTTPRSYKPDLEIVEENHPSNSKDSGLEREGVSPRAVRGTKVLEVTDISSKCPYYIRKKNHLYFNSQPVKNQMQPYSKFTIIAPAFTSNYVSIGVHNLNLLDQQSLANSEPSVADFPDNSDSEPLMLSGVPPYCRFGLARSVGNGLNVTNQPVPVQQNFGYSKFGIIYSAIRKPNASEGELQTALCAPNYSKITQPKVQHSTAGNSADMLRLGRPLLNGCQKTVKQKPLDILEEKPDTVSCSDIDLLDDTVSEEQTDGLTVPQPCSTAASGQKLSSGYVSLNQMLNGAPGAQNSFKMRDESSGTSPADSDLYCRSFVDASVVPEAPCKDSPHDSDISINSGNPCQNTVQGTGRSGYVSFQDAKVMPAPAEQLCDARSVGNEDCETLAAVTEDVGESPKYKTVEANSESLTDLNSVDFGLGAKSDSSALSKDEPGDCHIISNGSFLGDAETSSDLVDFSSDLLPALGKDSAKELNGADVSGPCLTPPETAFDSNISETLNSISKTSQVPKSPERTPHKSCKPCSAPSSNGYVAWNELLGSSSTNDADIATVPNGSSVLHVEKV